LKYVEEQTPEICLDAVKQNVCALRDVKEEYLKYVRNNLGKEKMYALSNSRVDCTQMLDIDEYETQVMGKDHNDEIKRRLERRGCKLERFEIGFMESECKLEGSKWFACMENIVISIDEVGDERKILEEKRTQHKYKGFEKIYTDIVDDIMKQVTKKERNGI
jgi:hypothetical protein